MMLSILIGFRGARRWGNKLLYEGDNPQSGGPSFLWGVDPLYTPCLKEKYGPFPGYFTSSSLRFIQGVKLK